MMNKIKVVIAGFALLVLGGCATGPGFNQYADSMQSLNSENGRIYLYRKSAFGAALQPKIHVNEEVVGKSVAKGFIFIDRPAGDYVISTSTESKRSLTLKLAEGEEKYVRFEVKMGILAGHVKPVLVDRSVGTEEIKATKYSGE